MTRVAIIGAGLAGLTAAHRLQPHMEVTVFEKSRGLGGRLATRRAEPYAFDHGAQFFKVTTDAFQAFIEPLIAAKAVQRWDGRFAEINHRTITQYRDWNAEFPHYVGAPHMNAIGKYLGRNLNIQQTTRVHSMQSHANQWHLQDDQTNALGTFDWVISAIPPAQAVAILPQNLSNHDAIRNVHMQGCFSLMLGFEQALPLEFDAALVRSEDISWISVNNRKPDRGNAYSLLIHSTNAWADAHIDDNRDDVMDHLIQQISNVLGIDMRIAQHAALHAWRYANIGKSGGADHFLDTSQQIGVCGDWCVQGRVESAFTSADNLAKALLNNSR